MIVKNVKEKPHIVAIRIMKFERTQNILTHKYYKAHFKMRVSLTFVVFMHHDMKKSFWFKEKKCI
jgi:hypothetical protein